MYLSPEFDCDPSSIDREIRFRHLHIKKIKG